MSTATCCNNPARVARARVLRYDPRRVFRRLLCALLMIGGPAPQATANPPQDTPIVGLDAAPEDRAASARPAATLSLQDKRIATDSRVFAHNRSRYLQARHALQTEQQRLENELETSQADLVSLRRERARLDAAWDEARSDPLAGLRTLSRSVEDRATSLLSPLNGILGIFDGPADAAGDSATVTTGNRYVTLVLPVVLVLTLLLARRRFPDSYREWRVYIHRVALALILLFPLSSLAQDAGPGARTDRSNLRAMLDRAAAALTSTTFPVVPYEHGVRPPLPGPGGNSGTLATAPTTELARLVKQVDAHLQSGRVSTASRLLSDAIERLAEGEEQLLATGSVATVDALAYLSRASLARELYGVAENALIEALKPLTVARRRALELQVPAGAVPPSRLPYPARVPAPLYLGLLHEKQERGSAARSRFEQEAYLALGKLVKGEGDTADLLNSLTLLAGTLDPKTEAGLLRDVDKLLRGIEERDLEALKAAQEPGVAPLRKALDSNKREAERLRADIVTLRNNIDEMTPGAAGLGLSALLLTLRSVGALLVVAALCFAAVSMAFEHALPQRRQRLHAFWWKLAESMGWVWVLSVISAPLGAAVVALSRRLYLNRAPAAADVDERQQAIPAKPGRRDFEHDGDRSDHDWDNVIRMLRDTKRSEAG